MNNVEDVLRSLVPKCAKVVDGRLKGGFVDWDSTEGQAVDKALLAMALLEELKELGFCHNYQRERQDLVEWIDSVNQIIKDVNKVVSLKDAIDIINQVEAEYNNGWIPCSEQMPPVETEVLIVAKRKWRDGTCKYITTTAMYEDGTVLENNSCWVWEDIEGEWNEEEDCYIIPEGWWEYKHYDGDDELNHEVDDKVIAWQPLPEPYQG